MLRSSENHHSTLLGLPLELRSLIYMNVFAGNIFGNFPMLRVCRQIYHEAREIAMRSSTLICHPSSLGVLRVERNGKLQSIEDMCKWLGSDISQVMILEICSCNSMTPVESYVTKKLAELSSQGIRLKTLIVAVDSQWFEDDLLSPEPFGILSSIAIAERLLTESVEQPQLRSVQLRCVVKYHAMFEEDLREMEEESSLDFCGGWGEDWMDDRGEGTLEESSVEVSNLVENEVEHVTPLIVERTIRLACQHYKVSSPSIRLNIGYSPLRNSDDEPDLFVCVSDDKACSPW